MSAPQVIPGMAFVGVGMTPYTMPLVEGDTVKARTTDESVPPEFRGLRGKVKGQMIMVTVEFPDGSVETFNREQLSLKERSIAILPVGLPVMGNDKPSGEAWQQG